MSFIKKRRKGDIVLFQVETQEIGRVRHPAKRTADEY